MAAPVTAVVFDIGRVLVEWDLRLIFRELIPDPAQRDWFVETVVTPEWHFQVDQGRDVADVVAERIAEFPEWAAAIRAYADRFEDSIPGPVPGSLPLVEALHARGMPLFAITNFGDEFFERFRPNFPILERFGDIVVSGAEKLAKPDAAIFHLAARRFGHAPGAMLFIDDSAANVRAAADLGWQVHHFVDAKALADDLAGRGLIA